MITSESSCFANRFALLVNSNGLGLYSFHHVKELSASSAQKKLIAYFVVVTIEKSMIPKKCVQLVKYPTLNDNISQKVPILHFRYDPTAEGRVYYTEMYDMLKNMDPPLGFGSKCPDRLAFKKLIRMNQVSFVCHGFFGCLPF